MTHSVVATRASDEHAEAVDVFNPLRCPRVRMVVVANLGVVDTGLARRRRRGPHAHAFRTEDEARAQSADFVQAGLLKAFGSAT